MCPDGCILIRREGKAQHYKHIYVPLVCSHIQENLRNLVQSALVKQRTFYFKRFLISPSEH